MSWYRKGTVSNTANSKTINGTGTAWVTDKIRAGDAFIIGSAFYEIASVDAENKLTLSVALTAANTNANYSILPLTGAVEDGAYIEADLVNAVAEALRKDKFFMAVFSDLLLSTTAGDMTVTFPDGSTVGPIPNWAKVSTAAASQDWANQVKTDVTNIQTDVTARQTDVVNRQADVKAMQDDVNASKKRAADSATLAGSWAAAGEGVAVVPGKYSALHYAAKASASATAADQDATNTAADVLQSANNVATTEAAKQAALTAAANAEQHNPDAALVFQDNIAVTDANAVSIRGIYEVAGTEANLALAAAGKLTVITSKDGKAITQIQQVSTTDATNGNREFRRTGSVGASSTTFTAWLENVSAPVAQAPKLKALAAAISSASATNATFNSTVTLGADGGNPMDATTLRQMQQAIAAVSSSGGVNGVMSTFIGDVSWWAGNPANIPTGYVTPNGQLDKRSDYPEIWALIDAGVLRSVDESLWNEAAATSRGYFTKGTITTGADANFRWPDLNGASTGSIGGLFLRGSGAPADAGSLGVMRQSASPNILGAWYGYSYRGGAGAEDVTVGSVRRRSDGNPQGMAGSPTTGIQYFTMDIDASRTNSPQSSANAAYGRNFTSEVRPNSISGTWIMRAKGTFSAQTAFNVYVTDAALVPNATKLGGAVRSVYKYGNTEIGVNVKAKVTTNATAVTKKVMELSVDGGTGVAEIDAAGDIYAAGQKVVKTDDARLATVGGKTGGAVSGTIDISVASGNGENPLVLRKGQSSGNAKFGGGFILAYTPGPNYLDDGADTYLQYDGTVKSVFHRHLAPGGNPQAVFAWHSNGNYNAYNGNFIGISDENVKDQIERIKNPLQVVRSLRGIGYRYTATGTYGVGYSAQDVEKVLPKAIHRTKMTQTLPDGRVIDEVMGIDAGGIGAAVNTEAINEILNILKTALPMIAGEMGEGKAKDVLLGLADMIPDAK